MVVKLPLIYLVRHGETAWSFSGQHTGRTDIPLTNSGEEQAQKLVQRLGDIPFQYVWTSPSRRARRTCEIAGFQANGQIDADLAEWDYGAYEGQTTHEIQSKRPGWFLFRDGCPSGENLADVGVRALRVVQRAQAIGENVLIFSHGHFLRVLACCWLQVPLDTARILSLSTASISILGYDHGLQDPVIKLWNSQ